MNLSITVSEAKNVRELHERIEKLQSEKAELHQRRIELQRVADDFRKERDVWANKALELERKLSVAVEALRKADDWVNPEYTNKVIREALKKIEEAKEEKCL